MTAVHAVTMKLMKSFSGRRQTTGMANYIATQSMDMPPTTELNRQSVPVGHVNSKDCGEYDECETDGERLSTCPQILVI